MSLARLTGRDDPEAARCTLETALAAVPQGRDLPDAARATEFLNRLGV